MALLLTAMIVIILICSNILCKLKPVQNKTLCVLRRKAIENSPHKFIGRNGSINVKVPAAHVKDMNRNSINCQIIINQKYKIMCMLSKQIVLF